jgi:hypothetical protein
MLLMMMETMILMVVVTMVRGSERGYEFFTSAHVLVICVAECQ